ncbi:MAG: ATP-binding protein, partial [Pirellulales bacterium]
HERAGEAVGRAEEKRAQAEQAIERIDRQMAELLDEAGLAAGEPAGSPGEGGPLPEGEGTDTGATAGLPSGASPHPRPLSHERERGATRQAPRNAVLMHRLERLPEYRETVDQQKRLLAQREHLEAQLAGHEELTSLSLDEIDARTERRRQQADQYESLIEQIRDIETRIRQAGQQTAIEEGLADVDAATDALAGYREQMERAAAGKWLLEDVETEHRSESQPPVLQRADRWFARFTRGRYRLVLDGGGGRPAAFRAQEVEWQRGLALEELSRGTQMQLLLAVRLAFAVSAEQGTAVPILLDEVLSSTDPERFAAVGDCVMALVAEGRQVFYFTCQPGDASAWQSTAGAQGQECRTIDLAAERRTAYEPGSLLTTTTTTAAVPPPEDRPIGEYAALLEPPPLRPAEGAASTHPAHLVDDPGALHRLLSAGVSTYGQLAELHQVGATEGLIDADQFARSRAKARLIDAFAEAWRIGRGRPLTREVLADAGVSETFLDGVTEMAAELDWDARRLIDALERPGGERDERAKGFQKKILRGMIDHLADTGHLDPREPLEWSDVRPRMLAAVADDFRAGRLRPDEVEAIFRHLWQRATERQP